MLFPVFQSRKSSPVIVVITPLRFTHSLSYFARCILVLTDSLLCPKFSDKEQVARRFLNTLPMHRRDPKTGAKKKRKQTELQTSEAVVPMRMPEIIPNPPSSEASPMSVSTPESSAASSPHPHPLNADMGTTNLHHAPDGLVGSLGFDLLQSGAVDMAIDADHLHAQEYLICLVAAWSPSPTERQRERRPSPQFGGSTPISPSPATPILWDQPLPINRDQSHRHRSKLAGSKSASSTARMPRKRKSRSQPSGESGSPSDDSADRSAESDEDIPDHMVDNAAAVIGIELLAGAQGIDFHRPARSSVELERVHATIRAEVAHYAADRYFAPDIEAAKRWVRSGQFAGLVKGLLVSREWDP